MQQILLNYIPERGRLLNCFQVPAWHLIPFPVRFCNVEPGCVLWVELILCNSWQAWIRKMGYIEITMKIMMSDSHNLCGEVVTPQHGLNKYILPPRSLISKYQARWQVVLNIVNSRGTVTVVQGCNEWYITYNWSTGDDPTVSQVSAVCSVGWLCPGWVTPTL